MICPPCADAADIAASVLARHPDLGPNGHPVSVCRDAALQPHGCTCQHGGERADA